MLGEPVARSGVVGRAVEFHAAARAAGAELVFTRFTVPGDGVRWSATPPSCGGGRRAGNVPAGCAGARLIPEMSELASGPWWPTTRSSPGCGTTSCDGCWTGDQHGVHHGGGHNLTVEQTAGTDRPRLHGLRGWRLRDGGGRGDPPRVARQPGTHHGRLPHRENALAQIRGRARVASEAAGLKPAEPPLWPGACSGAPPGRPAADRAVPHLGTAAGAGAARVAAGMTCRCARPLGDGRFQCGLQGRYSRSASLRCSRLTGVAGGIRACQSASSASRLPTPAILD